MHEIENKILEELLVAPLCIVQDRYGGCYSGAEYLAFNMEPYLVTELDVDAGDMSCRDFWEYEAKEYIIGKGNTPLEALCDLQIKLQKLLQSRLQKIWRVRQCGISLI